MSEENLESLLNDEVETETAEEEVTDVEESTEESEEEETEEATETEESTESTDEKEGEPSSPEGEEEPPLTKREEAFLKKANDEKRKRQELEQTYSQQQAKEQDLPDPFDDPTGYAKALEARNERHQLATRITISQEMMRDKHQDYDERELQFVELAKNDPGLIAKMQQSSNPAKFAYETAVKAERVAKFDNFDDAVKSEVEKQVAAATARIKADLEKEYAGKLSQAQKIPPSGAKSGSYGADSTYAGDDSLSDILGTKEDD